MSKRIEYIDLAKGICILLVVLYHLKPSFPDVNLEIVNYSCLFRMPLYFFLSGLFFKQYNGITVFFKKKVNNLVIPFLSFYLVFTVLLPNFLALFGILNPKINSVGWHTLWQFIYPEFFFNGPIWFLICLFEVNVFYYSIYYASNKITSSFSLYSCFIISLVLGYLGYLLGSEEINLPMYIDTSLTALPFFSLGHIINNKTSFLNICLHPIYSIVGGLLFAYLLYLFPGEVNFRINSYSVSFPHLIFFGLIGILLVISISKWLVRIPLVSYWGRYSIMILLTHNLLIVALSPLFRLVFGSNFISYCVLFLVIMLSYQVIIPFFIKCIPTLTAQKPLLR